MATWTSILGRSAALLNDQERANYTDTVLLPYLNIASSELQEIFELNNIAVTAESSATIAVPAGTSVIGFTTVPALPTNLIEIQELFESQTGQEAWTPVTKRDYLTPSILGTTPINIFGIWAWMDQEIHVRAAVGAIDLRLDYIKSIFLDLALSDLGNQNTILNTDSFFQYRVAALAAEFIDENITRADKLNIFALSGLERSLGISIKGAQSIATRRRPFRAAFKRRRTMI